MVALLGVAAVAAAAQMRDESGSIAGKLLVAAPSMPDPRFRETVIYMAEHDAVGALGLIVNRRIGLVPGTAVAEQFELEVHATEDPVALHWGGPVEPGRGFVLHTTEYGSDSTARAGDIAYSVDQQALIDMIEGRGPAKAMLVLGYAGWGPQQLESELARDDWIIVPADAAFVFEGDQERMWQAALDRFGVDL
jgi:putative transcriptional regulator